jgi:hypothetical protein
VYSVESIGNDYSDEEDAQGESKKLWNMKTHVVPQEATAMGEEKEDSPAGVV